MHYALVLIGAHDGSKTTGLVADAAKMGPVLLVEPVSWLFARLTTRYGANPNVRLCSSVIAEADGEVDFYAPEPAANDVAPFGDQLGSLNPQHAVAHDARFSEKITATRLMACTIASLFQQHDVSSIDTLVTDTEGYDARLLAKFPFDQIKPRQICFEYKHSDGVFHIGKYFAQLLLSLDAQDYKVRILDAENCLAVRQPAGQP